MARENNHSTISRSTDYFVTDIELCEQCAGSVSESGNDDEDSGRQGVKRKNSVRFDMTAVRWLSGSDRKNGRRCRPALIEMKYGDKVLDGECGLLDHLKDIDAFICNKQRYHDVLDTMESQFKQLHRLGLLELARGSDIDHVELSRDGEVKPEVLIILANHNLKSTILGTVLSDPAFGKFMSTASFELRFVAVEFAGYALYAPCAYNLDEFLLKLPSTVGRAQLLRI